MNIVIGIPARMGASRFPGKPLCQILGLPMIEHVYRRCTYSKHQKMVFVAACDDIIRQTVERFGGNVVMTPPEIERPALRVAEACKKLDLKEEDLVVVVQGDEPLVHPGMIDLGIQTLVDNPDLLCTNLAAEATEEERLNPNDVKVVTDLQDNALYMSRSPIPWHNRSSFPRVLKQLGIFFFRKKSLLRFQRLAPTPLEIAESIEMIRAIQHGEKIRMIHSPYKSKSVDTEEDRKQAEDLMKIDQLWQHYAPKPINQ